MESYSITWSFF